MGITHGTIEEIKKLSISEKILIVEEIWDDIANSNNYPELSENQQVELNKRIDAYHFNPTKGRTWDEIINNFNK